MYFPANPYEPVKYIAYLLLAVAFVSVVWNRCNERNTYTKVWFVGFLGVNILIPFILVQGVQFNLSNQNILVDTGEIVRGYYIPLFVITAVMILFTGAICLMPLLQKVDLLPERKKIFLCVCVAMLALDGSVNWTLMHEDLWRYFILTGPVSEVCRMYELALFCFILTERGWQRYKVMEKS
ncbi:MAG: hypothetical protein II270_05035 [Peptococcaceae bacterium]|nr:hypothetical protein [Peptococcaceae bacterium]